MFFFFLLLRFASPHYTSLWILFLNEFSLGWLVGCCCTLFYLFIIFFCFVFLSFFFFFFSFVTFTLKRYFSLVWCLFCLLCVPLIVALVDWSTVSSCAMYFAVITIYYTRSVYAVTKCTKHNDRLHVVHTLTHKQRSGWSMVIGHSINLICYFPSHEFCAKQWIGACVCVCDDTAAAVMHILTFPVIWLCGRLIVVRDQINPWPIWTAQNTKCTILSDWIRRARETRISDKWLKPHSLFAEFWRLFLNTLITREKKSPIYVVNWSANQLVFVRVQLNARMYCRIVVCSGFVVTANSASVSFVRASLLSSCCCHCRSESSKWNFVFFFFFSFASI